MLCDEVVLTGSGRSYQKHAIPTTGKGKGLVGLFDQKLAERPWAFAESFTHGPLALSCKSRLDDAYYKAPHRD